MDNFNEAKEAKTNKVRFSINPDGKIEFDAQGLSEWEAEAVINQVAVQAREQRSAAQKIREIKFTSEVLMHCTAIAFALVVVFGATFTVSRVVSTTFQSGVHHVR